MANEKFKVKFGLAVGDTVATVDGTTGNIVTQGTIDVQGGTVTDSTGALSITTGASNGNITLDPNGTGNVVMTFANGGNLTNDRNYVLGNIRQTVAASAGDIWGYFTGTTNPYRGISLDNYLTSTTTTGKRTGLVMRNYANAPRNSIIGESARGTNPSAPTILTNNSNLVEMVGNGYAATSDGTGFQATGCTISGTTLTIGTVTSGAPAVGQLLTSITYPNVVTAGTTITANISGSGSGSTWTVSNSQAVASSTIWGGGDGWIASNNGIPAGIRFQAFENWTTQTSGTGMIVTLSPLAATNGLAGAGFNALSMSLSSTTLASDSQTFRTRPAGAGGTNFAMLSLTESLATIGGDLRVNGNDIQASDGNTNITLTSNTLTSFAGDIKVGGNDIQASDGNTNITLTSNTLTTLAGDLQINGNDIQNSAGQISYAMTSDRSNTTINSTAVNFNTTSGGNMVNFTASGTQGGFTFSDPNGSGNNILMEVGDTKSVYALYGVSADGSVTPTVNYNGYRRVSGNNVATKTNDRLGQFTFNGNINTGTSGPSSNVVGGEIRVYATEDWTNTQAGTGIALEITKQGTNTNTNVFISSGVQTEITGDTIVLKDSSGALLKGGNINYRRTFGCFHKVANVTAAAANTVYNFDWYTDTTVHVGNQGVTVTSGQPTRVNIDVAGSYEAVVEMQIKNTDNAERIAWLWLAKNGNDLAETRIKLVLRHNHIHHLRLQPLINE